MFVKEFFMLDAVHEDAIRAMKPKFGFDGFGEAVYFRTYSRRAPRTREEALLPETNDKGELNWTGQESWPDTVIRVVNGTFSIRKDWYVKNNINWDEDWWQTYARGFAEYMFNMYWLPPGRGLWAMGTRFVYERGSMALNNCGFTNLGDNRTLGEDYEWMMDALMLGVGVGFHALRTPLTVKHPTGTYLHDIPDTREGWARSVRLLVDSYIAGARKPIMRYHLIRPEGLPIRGFGGLSSGPEPLKRLHTQIEHCFNRYINEVYDIVQLKTDIANMIGVCVVAGNVRRSAELGMGSIQDSVFMDLKDYDLHPEREAFGWMSNNTVGCEDDADFERLGEVARRVPLRGEPGVANWRNFKYGRIGKKNRKLKRDKARGLNPCGEIPLEDKELCNVDETAPTRCPDVDTWYKACEYATMYASTVSLLPTHWASTNAVVSRNRRIGVGLMDYTGWYTKVGLHRVTQYLRKGYKVVSKTNRRINAEAGVPEAIRKTTIKPGGTVPKLVGRTSGAGYPTFEYILRRMRIAHNNPIVAVLKDAGYPVEPDIYDSKTLIFSFPIKSGGAKPAERASLWEQANNLVTLQREWSDNAVSNTLYFRPKYKLLRVDLSQQEIALYKERPNMRVEGTKLFEFDPNHEEDAIEAVLASILPTIKAASFLPHTAHGVYKQMPEEGITREVYEELLSSIKPIDWSNFSGSDGEDEKYCQSDKCEIPQQ